MFGFVVLVVGVQVFIVFIIVFVLMFLIVFVYCEFNNVVFDCGIIFMWGIKVFGFWVGWMGGWGVVVVGMVVFVNFVQIVFVYFWLLIGQDLENNDWCVVVVVVIFIVVMIWVSW